MVWMHLLLPLLLTPALLAATDWGSVQTFPAGAVLENSEIRVEIGRRTYARGESTVCLTGFYHQRAAPAENQAGGAQLDGIWQGYAKGPGEITSVTVEYEGADRQTVAVVTPYATRAYSIFPGLPILRIEYRQSTLNIVDLGTPGGATQGNYVVAGAEEWIRPLGSHPDSYYNHPEYGDPVDAGSLNREGWFLLGLYHPANQRGWLRVMPVAHLSIVKPLWQQGWEFFPHFQGGKPPVSGFTGYLAAIVGGEAEIRRLGPQIAAWANGGEAPPAWPAAGPDAPTAPTTASTESLPGSVFREYLHRSRISPYKAPFDYEKAVSCELQIEDLEKASRAEVFVQYWGGHSGTSGQTFQINGGRLYTLPQPRTPGHPSCYFRFLTGNPPIPIALADLREGANTFTFHCDRQICHGFNWPHYWIYFFGVRVYYEEDKPCPRGHLVKMPDTPTAAQHVGWKLQVDDPAAVASVEYIGWYRDYDLDGDGQQAGWHYWPDLDGWSGHLGRSTVAPYHLNWENGWLPEQDGPLRVVAKINGRHGYSSITPPLLYERLRQKGSRVVLFPNAGIPENFGARIGQRRTCTIPLPDTLDGVVSAWLVCSLWSGAAEDGALHAIGLNGKMLAENPGRLHDWTYQRFPVPLEFLRPGDNEFFLYSETQGHMLEVNFPGPALLLRYRTETPPSP